MRNLHPKKNSDTTSVKRNYKPSLIGLFQTVEEFHDFFYSWFKNHYKIMSRVQRENIENLYKEEVEKWHRTTQSH